MKKLIILFLLSLLIGCSHSHPRKNCVHTGTTDKGDQLFECEDV